jgi:hypothetical protein
MGLFNKIKKGVNKASKTVEKTANNAANTVVDTTTTNSCQRNNKSS